MPTRGRPQPPKIYEALDLMRRLWQLNHELERLSARVLKRFGITAQQRMMLRLIGRYTGITAGKLSEVLCIEPATVSVTLARLEARGLVRRNRDVDDARRVVVALTPRGVAMDAPASGTIEAAILEMFDAVRPSDLRATHRVLDSLAHFLGEQENVPVPQTVSRARSRVPKRR